VFLLFVARCRLTLLFDRTVRYDFFHEYDPISGLPHCPEDFMRDEGKIWNRQIPQGWLKCSFLHSATPKTVGFHHFRPFLRKNGVLE
jgi:hypothetical protein